MKGHSAAPGKDFSAFLTGGDLGSKEREHCRDAQRTCGSPAEGRVPTSALPRCAPSTKARWRASSRRWV